jgi:hypothetical protein
VTVKRAVGKTIADGLRVQWFSRKKNYENDNRIIDG